MHEYRVDDKPWVETLSDIDVTGPYEAPLLASSDTKVSSATNVVPGNKLIRRIGASVPRAWVPIALRSIFGVAWHLPPVVGYRLHRLLGTLRPDMGDIERDYPSWIALHDHVNVDTRRRIMAEIARMPHPPLISVLMPVFNPPPDHLLAAVHSVQDQFYPWWELCIGDDASTDPAINAILQDAAERDHRIKLVRREQNGHISAASNSALSLATGPFVALLDHDDILPPHALHEVAIRIVAQPNVDVIYSDEDHIDDRGRRSHPYFKPDWNPELMLGQNLISHLGVYRRSLVEHIGGFRTGFEGSQDYDLALRMVAETQADRIAHIPKVLYHWRQGASDRTFSEVSHERCVQTGRRAIQEFVARNRPGAIAEPAPFAAGWTRVVYPLPTPAPLVSVIVRGDASGDALSACIHGLLNRTDYPALEILVPACSAEAGELPDPLLRDQRLRWIAGSMGLNQAAETARGSLLLTLDAHLAPNNSDWLREMVAQVMRPGVGAVGAKMLHLDGTVRHAGIAVGARGIAFTPFVGWRRTQVGYFGHLQLTRDVTAVSSMCMTVDRHAFLAVGGRDESLLPAVFGDIDLCLKLADIGCRTVWTPYAELTFRDEAPRHRIASVQLKRAAALMRQRWGRRLDTDRYWNANLSPESLELGLAFPPRTAGRTTLQVASTDAAEHSDTLEGMDPVEMDAVETAI